MDSHSHSHSAQPRSAVRVFVARALATALGAGYSPVAPGTAGTLVAVPLAIALQGLALPAYLGLVTALVALSILAAREADESWGTHDSGRIVIDEVCGYLVTVALVPRDHALWLAVGFVVFRALDILKPFPARWIDRRMPGGRGVILDDVVAGLYGMLILWLGHRYLPLS